MPQIKFTDRTVENLKPKAQKQVDYFDAATRGFGLRISLAGRKVGSSNTSMTAHSAAIASATIRL